MSLIELLALLLLGALGWFWYDSMQARELAMAGARAACRREGVQLLDESVSCRSLRPGRDEYGRLSLVRMYEFEYSGSGNDRYAGTLAMQGREISLLDVSAHRRADPGTDFLH